MKSIYHFWNIPLTIILLLSGINFFAQTQNENVFNEDFESGWGSWWADNGVWDIGIPSLGPENTHSGTACAATVLDANYSNGANTRLISPYIALPEITEGENILLKFWQWFIIENNDDQGYLQISADGGDWETVSQVEFDGTSSVWTQYVADLSSYSGSTIQVAFYLTSDNNTTFSGWYIDDVSIVSESIIFSNPEDFESGVGNWSADNGLWEVGIPTVGPENTHSGMMCAATVLDANYSNGANTRLISPEILIDPVPDQLPMLFFYYWFIIENNDDKGYLQISVNNGEWQTVSNPLTGTNDVWSQYAFDLSPYIESTIRIAFYFISDNNTTFSGWYIDDIRIEGIVTNVEETSHPAIAEKGLSQNYPNPFVHQTKIEYSISTDEHIQINIYNINGELIRMLVNERQKRGTHSVIWEGKSETNSRVVSGIYFYQLKTESRMIRKKMLLLN